MRSRIYLFRALALLLTLLLAGILGLPVSGASAAPKAAENQPAMAITQISPERIDEDSPGLSVTFQFDLKRAFSQPSQPEETKIGPANTPAKPVSVELNDYIIEFKFSTATTIHRQTLVDWVDQEADWGLGWLKSLRRQNLAAAKPRDLGNGRAEVTLDFQREELPLGDNFQWGPRGIEITLTDTTTNASRSVRSPVLIAPEKRLATKPGPLTVIAPFTARTLGAKKAGQSTPSTDSEKALTAWASFSLDKAELPILKPHPPAQPGPSFAKTIEQLDFSKGWLLWIDPALLNENSAANGASIDPGYLNARVLPQTITQLEKAHQRGAEINIAQWAMPSAKLLKEACCQGLTQTATTLRAETLAQIPTHTTLFTDRFEIALHGVAPAGSKDGADATIVSDLNYPLAETAVYHPGALVSAQGDETAKKLIGTDAEIEAQLSAAVTTSGSARLVHKQLARSFLAMKTRERPQDPRSTVVMLPSFSNYASAYDLGTALVGDPWVTPGNIETILGETPTTLQFTPFEPTGKEPDIADAVMETQASRKIAADTVAVLHETADTTENLSGNQDRLKPSFERAALWAISAFHSASTLAAVAQSATDAQLQVASAVRVQALESANIIAQESHLPLTLRNELPQPVTVRVNVTPSDARLQVGKVPLITIAANSSQQVKIPLKAIGNGNVTTKIWITDSRGARVSQPVVTALNIRAGLESGAVVITAAVIAVVFIFGLTRNIVRSRRFRHLRRRLSRNSD